MLAVVLVMSLGITAFAAETGTITIDNATIGQDYYLYKIFNADYQRDDNDNIIQNSDGKDVIIYTTDDNNQFFATMFGADGTASNGYFEYDNVNKIVLKRDVTDEALFGYLAGLVEGATADASLPATSETVEFVGLEPGYYVIKRGNGQTNAVTITTAKPNATVIDKNMVPGNIDKEIVSIGNENDNVLSIGDTIQWKLSFNATNYDHDEKVLRYNVKDTLDPAGWAEIDTNSIVVTVINQENETETAEYNLISSGPSGFEIQIDWVDDNNEFLFDATTTVEITYSATVTDLAATPNQAALKNTAHMDWDTDTDNTTPEGDGGDKEVESKLYNLGFTKVDGSDATNKLEGVKFELYRDEECTVSVNVTGDDGIYKVSTAATSNEVETDADGRVVIMGLEAGTYYLKEIETLDGYNKLVNAVPVTVGTTVMETFTYTVGEGENVETVVYSLNGNATIQNFKGVELPSTGGKGTMMLITFGTMVAVAFAVLMITQKKMSIYND